MVDIAGILMAIVNVITTIANIGGAPFASLINAVAGTTLDAHAGSILLILLVGAVSWWKIEKDIVKWIVIILLGIAGVSVLTSGALTPMNLLQNTTQIVNSYVPIPVGG